MRAEYVAYRFERCGPPASLSFCVGGSKMAKPGDVVKVGRWLYDDSVRCRVEIQYADIRYGSPDHEDPPELQEDVPGDWYVVSVAPPTDPENCPPSWKMGG